MCAPHRKRHWFFIRSHSTSICCDLNSYTFFVFFFIACLWERFFYTCKRCDRIARVFIIIIISFFALTISLIFFFANAISPNSTFMMSEYWTIMSILLFSFILTFTKNENKTVCLFDKFGGRSEWFLSVVFRRQYSSCLSDFCFAFIFIVIYSNINIVRVIVFMIIVFISVRREEKTDNHRIIQTHFNFCFARGFVCCSWVFVSVASCFSILLTMIAYYDIILFFPKWKCVLHLIFQCIERKRNRIAPYWTNSIRKHEI